MESVQAADFVVVGAGTAGSVVVRRLLDAGHRVAVVEAGPSDTNEEIADPFRGAALIGSEVDWSFSTEPQPCANNRVMSQARGKSLGGSSVLNGMIYVRGAQSDYDAWAAGGATGWAWQDIEPYFRELEAYDGPPNAARGQNGPLNIQRNLDPDPLVRAFVDAAVEAGHPYNDDYNSGDSRGASFLQHTAVQGRRVTAWRAYVGPVVISPLLQVITDAHVSRVLIEGGRAVGVEYLRDGQRHVVRAEQEVILSAGTLGTPQLLMLSGIGPTAHLHHHGIDVVADLPGVGQNLRDHASTSVVWETRKAMPVPRVNGLEAQFIADGVGGPIQPDRQTIFVSGVFSPIRDNLPEQGFTGLALLLHPHSQGQVRLLSADPQDPPVIDLGLLTDSRDLEALVDHVEAVRAVAAQPALAEWVKSEAFPGTAVTDRDSLRDYVRRSVDSGQHQVGTARMGTDPMAVVDPRLLVHGIGGLRIADASVMPTPPAGNTVGPAYLIGERAADFILSTRAHGY
ncbi:GMC family oxidoreductase N-terminal domain-containing protein [Streptomyces sp. TRM 70361]|uniref:GMC family oxidoreductase n=1 Tax=Streptomyces sp. TRM 70361 TaxID=3116553 RepID=UPI002E7C2DEB|nr:GMC family oxidoreductase N-terminal domain-containing protein [Streptomyces sp. TRM 70361]MEE1938256.1 GMC family oxidoreductase N-terminal domain-containing protein [Streptomyces sp. TRM 70361]